MISIMPWLETVGGIVLNAVIFRPITCCNISAQCSLESNAHCNIYIQIRGKQYRANDYCWWYYGYTSLRHESHTNNR